MTPLDYRWAHAVNSAALLVDVQQQTQDAEKHAFAAPNFVNAIEADIIWGEAKQTPVMGHPPATDGDLTLSSFLGAMLGLATQFQSQLKTGETPLIVKLDFKSSQAFEASSEMLVKFIASFPYTKGIFINADILAGPANSDYVAFDAAKFLQQVAALAETGGGKHRHKLVLSVGWTTANANEEEIQRAYTPAMVEEMLSVLRPYQDTFAVTFPLRATSVRKSWSALRPLLGPEHYGFTLWWALTQIPEDEIEWLFTTLESEFTARTFYDVRGFDVFLGKRRGQLASPQLRN